MNNNTFCSFTQTSLINLIIVHSNITSLWSPSSLSSKNVWNCCSSPRRGTESVAKGPSICKLPNWCREISETSVLKRCGDKMFNRSADRFLLQYKSSGRLSIDSTLTLIVFIDFFSAGIRGQTIQKHRWNTEPDDLGMRDTGKERRKCIFWWTTQPLLSYTRHNLVVQLRCPHFTYSHFNDTLFVCATFRHPGRAASTNCGWSSKTTTPPARQNANSSRHCSTPTYIPRALSACHCWTRRRTGARPSQSNRFYWASRTCSTSPTSRTQHRQRPTQSTGEWRIYDCFF